MDAIDLVTDWDAEVLKGWAMSLASSLDVAPRDVERAESQIFDALLESLHGCEIDLEGDAMDAYVDGETDKRRAA